MYKEGELKFMPWHEQEDGLMSYQGEVNEHEMMQGKGIVVVP